MRVFTASLSDIVRRFCRSCIKRKTFRWNSNYVLFSLISIYSNYRRFLRDKRQFLKSVIDAPASIRFICLSTGIDARCVIEPISLAMRPRTGRREDESE